MSRETPDKRVYEKIRHVRHGRTLLYPFCLLTARQRTWLHSLSRPTTRTLRDAFREAQQESVCVPDMLSRWMDDPAFQDALFISLGKMNPKRAQLILDAIIRAVVCQPLHAVCDLSGQCI
jgi:hypothetical protein